VARETLRDRARAMAQMRAIWHCEIFDTTPAFMPFNICLHMTRVSELQTLLCDVMFVYIPNVPCFVSENAINYAVN